jgi:hypothetical protein
LVPTGVSFSFDETPPEPLPASRQFISLSLIATAMINLFLETSWAFDDVRALF